MIPPQFHLTLSPQANPAAVIVAGKARFTVLTDRLIRLEYAPGGEFEDHASQAYWYRQQDVPPFQLQQDAEHIEIETEFLHLYYQITPKGFSPKTLSIHINAASPGFTPVTWHYGDKPRASGPLGGTARTLDDVSGGTRLDPGLMGRAGWSLLNDSQSVVFNAEGWVQPRAHPENLDLYFYGYGHDYLGCLRDFSKVAGPVPLIPRYILGNWWSRYWAFTQAELCGLMEEFEQHNVPLAVCIVDMDWHLDGWTGYTWNRKLWPDPQGFIDWLHRKGLRTALNLHPADGVGPHEEQYPQMAAALGMEPAAQEPVKFDIANPRFAAAYFDLLHHPHEAMGIDFWWIDWQQERVTSMPGLDPLWWLNHLHYFDLQRDGQKRPFVFSRWGGLGNHRYPIGFSGDTHITWESLAFQPPFTSTAANVGYSWWSHDIGGHMGGIEDDELYIRWVQYGVFSPILRLHCTKNPYHERRPWGRGPAAERCASRAMRLRHQLIPYIYSMAWRNHRRAIPLVTPMYYWDSEEEAAYQAGHQYWFGSELIAAPFTEPAEKAVGLSRQRVWLPDGEWFNFFNGEKLSGGKWRFVYGDLGDIPIFAKAGAIVPLGPELGWGGVANPEALSIHLFPGASNRFELYEDDGESNEYQQGRYAVTAFSQVWEDDALRFTIASAAGDGSVIPAQRAYTLIVHGLARPGKVTLKVNHVERAVSSVYDAAAETLTVKAGVIYPQETLTLAVDAEAGLLMAKTDPRPAQIRRLLYHLPIDTWLKHQIDQNITEALAGEISLDDCPGLNDAQRGALGNLLR